MFKIRKSWYDLLKDEFEKGYYKRLTEFLTDEYQNHTIYPSPENVFNALNCVSFENVKIMIIGQDPYHEPNQANGLSFSVQPDVEIPRSLQNIYKELHDDCGCYIPDNGDLTKWAKQGVLLLNSVLTVRRGQANSHRGKGWELLVSQIINLLNEREDPVIFIFWGNNAKAFAPRIDTARHYILSCSHPSPLSAHYGFFGCKHFSRANAILEKLGKTPIDWQIENIHTNSETNPNSELNQVVSQTTTPNEENK